MLTITIDIRYLPQRIDEAIAQSQAGVEVVDGDVPKAKIVPVDEPPPSQGSLKPRIAGLHLGAFEMATDFNEYLGDEFWGLKD